MDDIEIIELYWRRSEDAIAETDKKYGPYCYGIAVNLLGVHEDAEECVNDTYGAAWNAIPPERPGAFRTWLGRVTRNISIGRWRRIHAKKRFAPMEVLLSELDDCVPAPGGVERSLEAAELSRLISRWLRALPADDRALFVRRYWHGTPLSTLAQERGVSANRLAQRMYRLRLSLRTELEKEGITL